MAEEKYEITLLEDLPELGLHAGDKCGLPASLAKPLISPPTRPGETSKAPKARLHRTGL
jgi:hypothetical protein